MKIVIVTLFAILFSSPSRAQSYVLPSDYGIACDGTTDVTTGFQAMVTASSGKTIFIPAGNACVLSAHINLVSNLTIVGGGREVSGIKMIGQDYIFRIDNKDNISVSDIYFKGTNNYTSWVTSPIGAIAMVMSASHSNFTFRRLKLSGFNSTYLIYGGQSIAGVVSNTTFDDILVESTTANIPTDSNPLNNTNYVLALYSGAGGVHWENTTITNWQIDQTAFCFGIAFFSSHHKWNISNNRITNPGGSNTNSHCTNTLSATNAYGILVYDGNSDGYPSTNGMISNNYIADPIAAGIYIVGDGNHPTRAANSSQILITRNEIAGQKHTDLLLARGAIAVAVTTDVSVIGNHLYNNAIGINVHGQNTGDVSVLANHCSSVVSGSICLSMTAGVSSYNTDRRTVRGNFFNSVGTAFVADSSPVARFFVMDVSGNSLTGATTQVSFTNQFATFAQFSDNFFAGGGASSFAGLTGTLGLQGNYNLHFTAATLPAATNGSSVFVSDGTPATACTAGGTGSTAFRQNNAWKCF